MMGICMTLAYDVRIVVQVMEDVTLLLENKCLLYSNIVFIFLIVEII